MVEFAGKGENMSGVMTNLFGYKTTIKTICPGTEIHGGDKRTSVSALSPVGSKATVSATIAKCVALYGAMISGMEYSVIVNNFDESEPYRESASMVISAEGGIIHTEIQKSEETFDLTIYNPSSKSTLAATLDREVGVTKKFTCGYGKRNGTVLILSLWPEILKDGEALKTFNEIVDSHSFIDKGIVDDEVLDLLAVLSDNVYYRIKTGKLTFRGFNEGDSEWTPSNINKAALDTGAYKAKSTDKILGNPQIFVYDGEASTSKDKGMLLKFLKDKYYFHTDISEEEQSLVPILKEELIVPSYVLRTLKLVKGFSGEERHTRNILYYGEAGSGKSLSSQMIAKGLNKPYLVFSCSPNTSELDLIGQIIPKVGGDSGKLMLLLKQMHSLPTMEDLKFDLNGSFKKLTGKAMPEGMSEMDVSSMVDKKRKYLINQLANCKDESNDFEFVPSPIIQALTNGWVVEIQEIANIKDAGALTVLNQLLEISTGGSHRLITGETITRHPEAVVICTTNVEYAGCRAINQSVLDRMNYTKEILAPDVDQLIDIVSTNTKCNQKSFIRYCILCMKKIREYLSDAGIDDGVVGVRSVIDWVDNVMKLGDIQEGAMETIISKATFDTDVQKYLFDEFILKSEFPEILTFEEQKK